MRLLCVALGSDATGAVGVGVVKGVGAVNVRLKVPAPYESAVKIKRSK